VAFDTSAAMAVCTGLVPSGLRAAILRQHVGSVVTLSVEALCLEAQAAALA
jgi:hypothetical protein